MKKRVELSFGAFDVVEPTLRGWKVILTAVKPDDVQVLMQFHEHWAPGDAAGAALQELIPMIGRLPELAEVVARECLRAPDKPERLPESSCEGLTVSDVAIVVEAIVDAGIYAQISSRLKNAVGLVKSRQGSAGSAQA